MKRKNSDDEMLPEYEFSKMKGGVRGKYAKRYRETYRLVKIDPDVYEFFPTEKSVNFALRKLIEIFQAMKKK